MASLEKQNPERARVVAKTTLQEVMANAPAEAQKGLQKAFEAVQRRGSRTEVPVNNESDIKEN